MILKYSLPVVLAHPFVGVGYAARTIHGTDVSSGSYLSYSYPEPTYTYYFNNRSNTSYSVTGGLVVSGGVQFGARHVRVSPELRYVHWNQQFLNSFGGDGSFEWMSKQDEFFVLLGVSWR